MATSTTNLTVRVATDFSETPGPRSRSDGPYSGDKFLDEVLEPRFREAIASGASLVVDLDGCEGFATSFLEAVFGGLSRKYPLDQVLSTLKLKSDDEPLLKDEIERYIREARNR